MYGTLKWGCFVRELWSFFSVVLSKLVRYEYLPSKSHSSQPMAKFGTDVMEMKNTGGSLSTSAYSYFAKPILIDFSILNFLVEEIETINQLIISTASKIRIRYNFWIQKNISIIYT